MKKFVLALLSTLVITGCVALQRPSEAPFVNPHQVAPHGSLWGYFKARVLGSEPWASLDPQLYQTPTFEGSRPDQADQARITWVGHATVLIEYRGVAILTDPIWSKRASPVQFAGPARFSQPGMSFDELPPIDAVIISHDHYDHLDRNTIRKLGNQPRYLVPARIDNWLTDQGINPERISALQWWEHSEPGLQWRSPAGANGSVRFTALPSQHFSGRGILGRNHTLWASWAIEIDNVRIFFGGDTGYNPVQFKEIGERLGPFDFAIIPVGAYRPRSFMQAIHVNPAEALLIHRDVQARQSLGVHWGTFMLAAEHPEEVERDLAQALKDQGLSRAEFDTWRIGEARLLEGSQVGSEVALVSSGEGVVVGE